LPHSQQHLLEGDAMLRVLKLLAHQLGSVRLRRRPLARIVQALPQQKRRHLLALAAQISS
jgi:hypothetical protein